MDVIVGYETTIEVVALRERTGFTDFEAKVRAALANCPSSKSCRRQVLAIEDQRRIDNYLELLEGLTRRD